MNEQRLPFYRRIFFKLLVPVILVGITSSTLIVSYMSAPLEHFLVRQFDANLRLSSVMALRICEESFNYLLDLRLEANHEMNQVLRNEAKEKITAISEQFPHIHLLIVQGKTEVKASSLKGSPKRYEQVLAKVNDDSKLHFLFNSKKVVAHAQYFPFWDWHLIGFVY